MGEVTDMEAARQARQLARAGQPVLEYAVHIRVYADGDVQGTLADIDAEHAAVLAEASAHLGVLSRQLLGMAHAKSGHPDHYFVADLRLVASGQVTMAHNEYVTASREACGWLKHQLVRALAALTGATP